MQFDDLKADREKTVQATCEKFLRRIAQNLSIPVGINGRFDIAFGIDRKRIIGKAMLKIGKEFTEDL